MKRFIITVLFFSYSIYADQQQTIFSKIEEFNLATFSWSEREWPQEAYCDYLKRAFSYQKNPQGIQKRKKVFSIFSKYRFAFEEPNCALQDATTWEDLNLFCGQSDKKIHFAAQIDRTETEFGRVTLLNILAQPITDIEKLKERQGIIRCIAEKQDHFTKINSALHEIGKAENILLSFWGWDAFKNAASRHYFNIPLLRSVNKKLNTNEHVLTLNTIMGHNRRITFFITSVLASVLLPIYAISNTLNYKLPLSLSQTAERLRGSGGRFLALLSLVNNKFVQSWATLSAGMFCSLYIKSEAEWARDNFYIYVCQQEKLMHIARFIKATKQLAEIVAKDEQLQQIPQIRNIAILNQDLKKQTKELQKLVTLLQTNTFQGAPSTFSYAGRILVAYQLMDKVKNDLERVFIGIGYLDAYTSAAKLVNEFKDKSAQFSFANFVKTQKPVIELKKFWNPFINANVVVTNSIQLGVGGVGNLIITGPNAAGKSTIIKAIALLLILTQTFGIGPALKITITPFSLIITYLNIIDDIAAGNSLFKSQVLRVHTIIDAINTRKGFSFVAIDEMFRGTTEIEGQAAAFGTAKYLGALTGNLCLIATHFPLLTTLENETGSYLNYKVSVGFDSDGNITYPFKLERGISDQQVAIDILRQEGFSGIILDEANRIIKG